MDHWLPYQYVTLVGLLLVSFLTSSCTAPPSSPPQLLIGEPAVSEVLQHAQAGDPNAQNQLGIHYSEGRGLPQNYLEAKDWFKKAADQGHAGAQVNLGTEMTWIPMQTILVSLSKSLT